MLHTTRKRAIDTTCGAAMLALALAASLAAPWSGAAHAAGADDAEHPPIRGCMGGIGGGGIGGAGGGANADASVDEPFATIVRIIPERGMTTLLFLPALPIGHDSIDADRTAMQALYLERASVDDPEAWEPVGTYEWDEDWRYYATEGGDTVDPVYAPEDDQRTTPLYCTVSYFTENIDYRDFYLRASVVMPDGSTTVFDPALASYPAESLPNPDEPEETPPNVVNPPDTPSGDSGGNRGGVGQGESERIEPESEAKLLPSSPDGAYTSEESAPSDEAIAREEGDRAAADNAESAEPASASKGSAPNAKNEAPRDEDAPAGASSEPPAVAGEQVPGFLWAAGITACAVVGLGLLIALVRRAGR